MLFAEASYWSILFNVVIILVSLVLMLVVLIQRGKGGGLVGAFGGPGGSSAFGSKAGDTFTRVTLWMAAFWVMLIMVHVKIAAKDAADSRGTSAFGVEKR